MRFAAVFIVFAVACGLDDLPEVEVRDLAAAELDARAGELPIEEAKQEAGVAAPPHDTTPEPRLRRALRPMRQRRSMLGRARRRQ